MCDTSRYSTVLAEIATAEQEVAQVKLTARDICRANVKEAQAAYNKIHNDDWILINQRLNATNLTSSQREHWHREIEEFTESERKNWAPYDAHYKKLPIEINAVKTELRTKLRELYNNMLSPSQSQSLSQSLSLSPSPEFQEDWYVMTLRDDIGKLNTKLQALTIEMHDTFIKWTTEYEKSCIAIKNFTAATEPYAVDRRKAEQDEQDYQVQLDIAKQNLLYHERVTANTAALIQTAEDKLDATYKKLYDEICICPQSTTPVQVLADTTVKDDTPPAITVTAAAATVVDAQQSALQMCILQ
jgi:hypothetical protein